jgi:hypothetical protein
MSLLREHSAVRREYFAGEGDLVGYACAYRLPACPQLQVFKSVIQSVAVLVVNVLAGEKPATDVVFHRHSVFEAALALDDNYSISESGDVALRTRSPARRPEGDATSFTHVVKATKLAASYGFLAPVNRTPRRTPAHYADRLVHIESAKGSGVMGGAEAAGDNAWSSADNAHLLRGVLLSIAAVAEPLPTSGLNTFTSSSFAHAGHRLTTLTQNRNEKEL